MENTEKRIPLQRISIHNIYADKNYLAIKLNQESTGAYAKVQVTDNTSGKRGDKKYFYVKAVEATDIEEVVEAE